MTGWQDYLEQSILDAGFLHGAILSSSGETIVTSSDFFVSPEIARKLLGVLHDEGSTADEVFRSGFTVSGMHFALNRADNDDESELKYLVGRCKTNGEPALGIIVTPTYKSILVAVHDPLHSPDLSFGRANIVLTCLAELLMSHDF